MAADPGGGVSIACVRKFRENILVD